jgi:hypothetical protein
VTKDVVPDEAATALEEEHEDGQSYGDVYMEAREGLLEGSCRQVVWAAAKLRGRVRKRRVLGKRGNMRRRNRALMFPIAAQFMM